MMDRRIRLRLSRLDVMVVLVIVLAVFLVAVPAAVAQQLPAA
jgi:hypothetical protein